ncbi:MAG: hypothetical protein K2N85_02795 [Lachnospiraceae bacterium]|nr:hypothetical protein [Lachnospiraceae bacterium]
MNYKNTLIPSILLLLVIPLIYGTANLDYIKSADCLERMVALIGIPMFTSLFYREQSYDLYSMVALRPFPFRAVAALRIGISAAGTFVLVMVFEVYMCVSGSKFPFGAYTVRALAACMVLGFAGLLCASVMKNTVAGYLGAFCFYFVVQAGVGDSMFNSVTNGIHPLLIISLCSAGAIILLFCKPTYK